MCDFIILEIVDVFLTFDLRSSWVYSPKRLSTAPWWLNCDPHATRLCVKTVISPQASTRRTSSAWTWRVWARCPATPRRSPSTPPSTRATGPAAPAPWGSSPSTSSCRRRRPRRRWSSTASTAMTSDPHEAFQFHLGFNTIFNNVTLLLCSLEVTFIFNFTTEYEIYQVLSLLEFYRISTPKMWNGKKTNIYE